MTRTGVLALAAGLMALALAGCGDGGANAPASSAPPAPTGPTLATTGGSVEVAVKDFAFSPSTLTVPVGTTVLWRFQDSAQHNVTADDQSFKSPDLSNGQTFVTTFTKAGTFNYICTIHPFMKGTVTVR